MTSVTVRALPGLDRVDQLRQQLSHSGCVRELTASRLTAGPRDLFGEARQPAVLDEHCRDGCSGFERIRELPEFWMCLERARGTFSACGFVEPELDRGRG